MSVSQPDVIDFVATPPGNSNEVHLVIIDHLEWVPLAEHCVLVKNKVNAYANVVVSGKLASTVSLPLPAEPRVIVVLVVAHQPPPEAKPFFDRVEGVLGALEMGFRVMPMAEFGRPPLPN
jgi:hypothetical protein